MNNALTIRNLHKTYDNGFQALKGIDLEVKQGDFFALLGPNGAGKSTTIGIITSLVNKSEGDVSIFGYDLDTQAELAKQQIGLVPQEFNFSQFEPVEEILINQAGYYGIPRQTAKEKSDHYLKQLDLWEKRKTIARNLSGGMKRRLMIARALIHEPRLLILDEPTAGVDIEIRRSTWEFLTKINEQGTTIILTTHYLEEAEQLCKHMAIINRGLIAEHSSMSEILARLKVQTFVLTLQEAVTHSPNIPEFHPRLIDEHTIEVVVEEQQGLNSLFEALAKHNLHVSSFRNKSNRLEELFLQLIDNSDKHQETNA
ncbi:MAG: ABC transporter ATP-binding protein [Gammaproteobacteria bacterium]|nr:ABC transporter ATP-binding protein [Gammaproteobacteria bacterium]